MASLRKAVVIGASSGIGRALALKLSREGYAVGLASRRLELLQSLQLEMSGPSEIQRMDVRQPEEAGLAFRTLVSRLGGVDLVVLNAGVNPPNPEFQWEKDREILEINVLGITALAHEAVKIFLAQGHGHLVGVSSILGQRGVPKCPAYSASKAFLSNYLEGLRMRLASRGILVTDIRPGFVATEMVAGSGVRFWMASCETAAAQILDAIRRRKKTVYVTQRWALIARLLRIVPERVMILASRKLGRKENHG